MKKENKEQPQNELYNLDVIVSVNLEHHFPYEVSYKLHILNDRFEKRLSKLKPYIQLTRSLLFFDVLIVTVCVDGQQSQLVDQVEKLNMKGEKVIFNESNQKQAMKFQKRLESALHFYLNQEAELFKELLNQERNFIVS